MSKKQTLRVIYILSDKHPDINRLRDVLWAEYPALTFRISDWTGASSMTKEIEVLQGKK